MFTWIAEAIVRDDLPFKKRKHLDIILRYHKVHAEELAPPVQQLILAEKVPAENIEFYMHELYSILVSDGYMDATRGGHLPAPSAYRFQGYVKEFNGKFRRRLGSLLQWLITILTSIITSYITTRLITD